MSSWTRTLLRHRRHLNRSALRQADRAARLDKPDWQILLKLKTDGIGLLLPDVQQMRAAGRGPPGAVPRRRSPWAASTTPSGPAKTMFAMSRHLGEHPTLIGNLVGIAIANIAIVPLEEMLEQPGCPNLYWALTNLPVPLVSAGQGHGRRAGNDRGRSSATWTTAPR